MNYSRPVPEGMDGLAFRRGEEARETDDEDARNPYHDRLKRLSWYTGWRQRDGDLTADTPGTVTA